MGSRTDPQRRIDFSARADSGVDRRVACWISAWPDRMDNRKTQFAVWLLGSVLGQITTTSCLPVSGDRAKHTHDGKTASQPSLFGNSIALSFEGLGLSRYPKFNLSRASTQQPADFFCKEFQPGQHRQEAPVVLF